MISATQGAAPSAASANDNVDALDAGDVIVHLFRPEVRSFYNLERMWSFGDAPPVTLAN